ncbi:MAG: uracil-DNA glycosylase [Desulfurococcales archaeon]|nr:uracil-DNA glycosylase [Desulfurococcales archaeon]
MKNPENEKTSEIVKIINEIKNCTKCPLYKYRTNPVPGEGPLNAKVMFIGEAPGRNEDTQGRPFVGKAGELLDYLLSLASLKRDEVYITNVVKCRPPNNRDPSPEEISSCLPYLRRQIRIIEPKIIVCLGRFAGYTIFHLARLKWGGMYRSHGKVYSVIVEGIPVKLIATFHPASAFYKREVQSFLEEDFKEVIASLIRDLAEPYKERKTLFDFM